MSGYLMPYRGYEEQMGRPRERDFVADGIALVDEARKTHARVGILGISIGTGVATQVALARKPDKLWLVTPYDKMTRVANGNIDARWLRRVLTRCPRGTSVYATTHPLLGRLNSQPRLWAKTPAFVPVFSFVRSRHGGQDLRTIAYVDGYNLFYGCLRGTPFKWLDVASLLRHILRVQDPGALLVRTRYFTSRVMPKFSPHGLESEAAQLAYLRALEAQPSLDVMLGRYTAVKFKAMRFCRPPRLDKRVETWRLEEKETDVSLAVSMYRDVAQGVVDQILLVSNDSDLSPALRMIREDFPQVRVGIVIPSRSVDGCAGERRVTEHLERHAHWTREHIHESELRAHQFFDRVKTGKRPADRPALWSQRALETLKSG